MKVVWGQRVKRRYFLIEVSFLDCGKSSDHILVGHRMYGVERRRKGRIHRWEGAYRMFWEGVSLGVWLLGCLVSFPFAPASYELLLVVHSHFLESKVGGCRRRFGI